MALARVINIQATQDRIPVSSFGVVGGPFEVAGQRRVTMEIELVGNDPATLGWLIESLQGNGMRLRVEPDGSPIIRPEIVPAAPKTDEPKTTADHW